MSKLRDITDAIAARLATMTEANGYSSDAGAHIVRGQSEINADELPACLLYIEQRSTESDIGERARQTVQIVIEVFAAYSADPELIAIGLLDDIATVVEDASDTTLGNLLRGPLAWQSDEIIYPTSAGRVVGARVTYQAPHVRRYGNPE